MHPIYLKNLAPELRNLLDFLAPDQSSFFKEAFRLDHALFLEKNAYTLMIPYKTLDFDKVHNRLSNLLSSIPWTIDRDCIKITGLTEKQKERVPDFFSKNVMNNRKTGIPPLTP